MHLSTVISKTIPFNTQKKIHDSYSNYCLKTDNKKIHELLNNIKIAGNDVTTLDESLQPFIPKLKSIFSILNYSLVSCICYRENYTEISHHNISILENNPNCNCNECLYQKLNTIPLWETIKKKSIKHSDDLRTALNEGYYSCKLGEHIWAWRIFNSIAENTGENNEPVLHFLSQHNGLAIYNFIDVPWWENESESILPQIENIDLDNILHDLKVHPVVKAELIKVKEDYHLNYSRVKIEEYLERIINVKKIYTRKGSASGPQMHRLIKQELHILFTFYSSNNIVSDDFAAFRNTMTKGIEGLFASYSTTARDKYRYKAFDSFILSMMLFYVEEESLKRFIDDYKIDKINIKSSEIQYFITVVSNFFNGQITKHLWVPPKLNSDISKQDYFSPYRQLLRHMFSRMMVILSKLNLTVDELKPMTEPFVDFLVAEKDLNHSSWKCIANFLEAHLKAFEPKQLQKIIDLVISEKKQRVEDDSFRVICYNAGKNSKFLVDITTIHELIQKLSYSHKSYDQVQDMRLLQALWHVTNNTGKELIKNKAIEYLHAKFDASFYEGSIYLGIFNKHENLDLLNHYISYGQSTCHKFDLLEEHGICIPQSYSGINFFNCIAYLGLDFKQQDELKVIAQKSDYYNWLVNYKIYDYSNFNFRWLVDACPYYIKIKLHKIKSLKIAVAKELQRKENKDLGNFYLKYLFMEK